MKIIQRELGITPKEVKFVVKRSLLKKKNGDTPTYDTFAVSNFLDSGAFSMQLRARAHAKEHGCSPDDYYETEEFEKYLVAYAEFIKTYPHLITHYANLDVIGSPELTWRHQQKLEALGVKPIPVVHFGSDLSWLKKYLDAGYDYIGLGGLIDGTVNPAAGKSKDAWIAECFDIVCSTPDRTPSAKIHGFGVTTWSVLRKFPWFSVDSASWAKMGAFGSIYVPAYRKGEFKLDRDGFAVVVSKDSKAKYKDAGHYFTMSQKEQAIVQEWLDQMCIPLGEQIDDKVIKEGVMTNGYIRRIEILYTFEILRRYLPPWNRPFHLKKRKGFGF
jgi:hypothetical protein